jgi:hypothetical protein
MDCFAEPVIGPDPLARNDVRAQLEPLVGSEVPQRPANPFLTRTRGLCGLTRTRVNLLFVAELESVLRYLAG